MARVVVVGAGVSGLGLSLTLGRRGHDVTVVERDPGLATGAPVPASMRRGTPQARHSHAFLALLRNRLRDAQPDVLERLLEAGATELRFLDDPPPTLSDRSPRPGDEDLVALGCRRTTFEDVVRAVVLEEKAVTFLDGLAVQGLVTEDPGASRPPLVTGVTAKSMDGATTTIAADAVVDASGRRSRLPDWLAALGVDVPEPHTQDCGIVYLTRFYSLLPGVEPPVVDGPIGGDLGYFKYMVFPGDNRMFSVTAGLATDDDELRHLLHGDAFDLACRLMPASAPWVDPAVSVATDEVAVMAGLKNQRRNLVVDGRPLALGVHAIGDATVCTNPLYGRGCSLGWVHAELCADALEPRGWNTEAASVAMHEATARELDPWYAASVEADRAAIAARTGGDVSPFQELMRDGFMPAARTDPDVYRAFLRSLNLLDPPGAILQDANVLAKITEAYQQREQREAPEPLGPSREELLAALHS